MDYQPEKASDLLEDLFASELERHSWFRDSSFLFLLASIGLWVCAILFVVVIGFPEILRADLRRPLYMSVAIASGVWLSVTLGGLMLTINKALVMRREAHYLSKRAIVALMKYLDEEDDEKPPELRFESKQFTR